MKLAEKYYTVPEVSEMFKVSPETVRNWIYRDKTLKVIKISGSIRIPSTSLKDIIQEIN